MRPRGISENRSCARGANLSCRPACVAVFRGVICVVVGGAWRVRDGRFTTPSKASSFNQKAVTSREIAASGTSGATAPSATRPHHGLRHQLLTTRAPRVHTLPCPRGPDAPRSCCARAAPAPRPPHIGLPYPHPLRTPLPFSLSALTNLVQRLQECRRSALSRARSSYCAAQSA